MLRRYVYSMFLKTKKSILIVSIILCIFIIPSNSVTALLYQDDNEGHTFDFSPYIYNIRTSFSNTHIPDGSHYIIPNMALTSHFTVDQAFQDYFHKWWRRGYRYVHEIEERIISGSAIHYFNYDGDYVTTISDTFVDYEVEDDPEWELHVRDPDINLNPEQDYFVTSFWRGFQALTAGIYRNSHWLTSEIDGFGFGFTDYDHLLREEFTLEITSSGGGPFIRSTEKEHTYIPLSLHKSTILGILKVPEFNLNIEVRKISDCEFKIVSDLGFYGDTIKRNDFNKWSLSLLEREMTKNSNKTINTLLTLENPILITEFMELAKIYNWDIQSIKLEYQDGGKTKFLHSTLYGDKTLDDVLKKAGINKEAIIGIYFAEINSKSDLLYDFYSNNNAIIKTFNLISLYVEHWLMKRGFNPSAFAHIGFIGE